MRDLDEAKRVLLSDNFTLALIRNDETYVSSQRGIAPLLELFEKGQDVRGWYAADRIVGKAAALLYAHLGVGGVYAGVLTKPAAEILSAHGIAYEYGVLADAIVNRAGDGPCPMETAVADVTAPEEAVEAVRARLAALRGGG